MTDQRALRREITALTAMQDQRVAMVAERKKLMDTIVEREQRRIDNLKSQLTIGVVA